MQNSSRCRKISIYAQNQQRVIWPPLKKSRNCLQTDGWHGTSFHASLCPDSVHADLISSIDTSRQSGPRQVQTARQTRGWRCELKFRQSTEDVGCPLIGTLTHSRLEFRNSGREAALHSYPKRIGQHLRHDPELLAAL